MRSIFTSVAGRCMFSQKHLLKVGQGSYALGLEPFLELALLDVLEPDAGVDGAVDDRLRDVHSDANGLVVGRLHAVVLRELVDLRKISSGIVERSSVRTWILPNSPT